MPIVHLKQWSVFLLVGTLIVVLLSQLTNIDRDLQHRRHTVTVFQPENEKRLTDDNLVDSLSKFPLQNQIIKVGWDHAILTIDLLGSEPDEIWDDMMRLIVFSYADVDNVKQVLMRVFVNKAEARTLYMSAETRRSEWSAKELSELKLPRKSFDTATISKIRLYLSASGKRWLANFSN
ncbi:hypothetical protein [Cohnella abietis]|uniref:DUF4825 domain-containing protein n=1 Tax=Cohnella abietis TaxID=2507935 RepID=A0A3T1D507_9BACL|nr:hypothetical protein [Cohnella abietis]BBI33193.1 hypothetical protein KCTCHS21_25920 [Cohnella abietis]